MPLDLQEIIWLWCLPCRQCTVRLPLIFIGKGKKSSLIQHYFNTTSFVHLTLQERSANSSDEFWTRTLSSLISYTRPVQTHSMVTQAYIILPNHIYNLYAILGDRTDCGKYSVFEGWKTTGRSTTAIAWGTILHQLYRLEQGEEVEWWKQGDTRAPVNKRLFSNVLYLDKFWFWFFCLYGTSSMCKDEIKAMYNEVKRLSVKPIPTSRVKWRDKKGKYVLNCLSTEFPN